MKGLAPSLLSADFSMLAKDVAIVEEAGAKLLHMDVMDGHFVPNISYGAGVMKSLLGKTKTPFDVHLMIENPDFYIKDFVTENTEYIVVHQESTVHLDRTIEYIKSFGIKAGVAINPSTPVGMLECLLDKVDLVLVMSVNPGFGGQKFIPTAIEKIQQLEKIRKEKKLKFEIEVDGGITLDNLKSVMDAGADVVVAGSAVFKADDVTSTVKKFVNIINGE